MSNPEFDEHTMEEFLDNLMSDDQRREFLAQMKNQDSFAAERDLQSRIDQALMNRFQFSDESPNGVAVNPVDEQRFTQATSTILNRRNLIIALAASLAGLLLFGFQQYLSTDRSPFFEVKRLAGIYEENVERGFKPYYECHDMVRFAGTFEHRFGVGLTLTEMPDDRKMLGISYLGGVSRDTVAMLCSADGEPVMVFIDNDEHHDDAATELDINTSLNLFTRKSQGMVFYEVTPLDKPFMLDYVTFAN